jgi:TrmH family RNA methyltransferase
MLLRLPSSRIAEILQIKNKRQKQTKFLIEGLHLLQEIFKNFVLYELDFVVFSSAFVKHRLSRERLAALSKNNIRVYEVSDKLYAKLTELENPEGVMAVLSKKEHTLEDLLREKPGILLFCVEVQDPGNLGTIFRVAEAFGVSGIILSKGTVDPFNPKVLRAGMGSVLRLPFCITTDPLATLAYLSGQHFEIIGTDARRGEALTEVKVIYPAVIVLGSEARGLPKKLVDNMTKFVKIPISNRVESLNVAMAASIILYELAKK